MEETLQLRDVLAILQRRMRFIVMFITACLGAALLFLLVAKPEYEAVATLKYNPAQFDISKEKQSFNSDLFDRLIAGEIAAVSSPAVLLKTIKSENLLNDPELSERGLRDLFSSVLDAFQIHSQPEADKELWVMERFKKRLSVMHPDRTNIISISYRTGDPEKSARVANAVANIFLAQHLEDRLATMPLAAKWLSERKATLRDKWRESQSRVEKFKADNNLSYLGGEKLREQQVDRLNEQLILASTRTEAARARIEKVRQLLKSRDYQQLANVANSNVLTRLRDRFAEASQREASLSATLLPSHPSLGEVRAEVGSLRKQIEEEGKRILDDLEVTFQSAQERERLIRENFDKSIGGIQDASGNIVKLRELKRIADTDREIYEAFLNRSNETLEQSTGQFANFSLIKVAYPPTKPAFPSKLKVLLLTAFGSVAAAFGIAFLREALGDSVHAARAVQDPPDLPILTRLPEVSGLGRRHLNGGRTSDLVKALAVGSPFAIAISRLYRSIRGDSRAPAASRILGVTSAAEGVGKTLVASSLAQMAATSGVHTLLIDANWRHPSVHHLFGLRAPSNGRSGSNGNRDGQVVVTHPSTGLDIVPAMTATGSQSNFTQSPEFREMLDSARDHYDLVVVDMPTAAADPESRSIANVADEIILVVGWNDAGPDKLNLAKSMLGSTNANIAGLVLNRVDPHHLADEAGALSGQAKRPHLAGEAGPAHVVTREAVIHGSSFPSR